MRNRFLFSVLVACFLALAANSLGQSVAKTGKPAGWFLEDSVLIGDTLHFSLSYRHHRSQEVVFPDTSFHLGHFEILSKRYFPTKTTDSISLDSAVYILRTFELQPFFRLSLPVFILQNGDSVIVNSTSDSVRLKELITTPTDSLQLAENVTPVPLASQFNYPFLIIGLVILLLLLAGLVWLFGKPIKKLYERYMAQTRFTAFKSRYDGLIRKFRRGQKTQTIEEAVSLWKNYLTDLEERPINSFTTKEIAGYYNEESIGDVLKLCDKAIYGGQIENQENETTEALLQLKDFSVRRYHQLQKPTTDAEPVAS